MTFWHVSALLLGWLISGYLFWTIFVGLGYRFEVADRRSAEDRRAVPRAGHDRRRELAPSMG